MKAKAGNISLYKLFGIFLEILCVKNGFGLKIWFGLSSQNRELTLITVRLLLALAFISAKRIIHTKNVYFSGNMAFSVYFPRFSCPSTKDAGKWQS